MTAWSLRDPVDAFAGDKFRDAIATASAATDSFELQLEELGPFEGGSSFKDNLQSNTFALRGKDNELQRNYIENLEDFYLGN